MTVIDFILNLAGLLLWLNWRAVPLTFTPAPGTSLASTLRAAGPPRPRFYYLGGLLILLAVRALFYWQVGEPVHWSPRVHLGPITLAFRSDLLGRMFLFSLLSFAETLGIFYLWLLWLSWLNSHMPAADSGQRLVRAHLGRLDRWPGLIKLILPLLVTALAWCALNPLVVRLDLAPSNSLARVLEQGTILGLSVYLTLKFLIAGFLIVSLLNSYVYFGELPLWNFINATARRLLRPVQWLPLKFGRLDLAPLLEIALVLAAAEFAQRGLARLYQHLI